MCVRVDSYESLANQSLVRSFLNGRFANTAFCILAPDGETRLTRSGRSPSQQFPTTEAFAAKLNAIADDYQPKGKTELPPVPDFNRFGLALNVAAADERILVLVATAEDQIKGLERRLRPLAWSNDVQGRFHFDLDSGSAWKESLSLPADAAPGIYFIKPGAYGLDGKIISKLEPDAENNVILAAMAAANKSYKATTVRKNYSDHVREGKRKGITIEMAVPFGEDRDSDGKIDHAPGAERPPRYGADSNFF